MTTLKLGSILPLGLLATSGPSYGPKLKSLFATALESAPEEKTIDLRRRAEELKEYAITKANRPDYLDQAVQRILRIQTRIIAKQGGKPLQVPIVAPLASLTPNPRASLKTSESGQLMLDTSGKLLASYLDHQSILTQIPKLWDDWIATRLPATISDTFIEFSPEQSNYKRGCRVVYDNVMITKPVYSEGGKTHELYPGRARTGFQGGDYKIGIQVVLRLLRKSKDGSYKEVKQETPIRIEVGEIPCLLGSRYDNLSDKTPEERVKYGEDTNDPRCYFIVKGTEKVLLMQEQVRKHAARVEYLPSRKSLAVSLLTNTASGQNYLFQMHISIKRRQFRIALRALRRTPDTGIVRNNERVQSRTVGVLQVFRLLGYSLTKAKKEILKYIPAADRAHCEPYLTPSIEHANKLAGRDVDYIIKKTGEQQREGKRSATTGEQQKKQVLGILDVDLLPNITGLKQTLRPDETVEQVKNRLKAKTLAWLTAMLLMVQAGRRKPTNRNSWGNKQLLSAGPMCAQLFSVLWRRLSRHVQDSIKSKVTSPLNYVKSEFSKAKNKSAISDGFKDSFTTSDWGVKGVYTISNVVQTLKRESFIATLTHILRVEVSINRKDRKSELRQVQDQLGIIDPTDSSESESAGLTKVAAITMIPSDEVDDVSIFQSLGQSGITIADEPDATHQHVLASNGICYGFVDGDRAGEILRSARRKNDIPRYTCIYPDQYALTVYTYGNRACRPLLPINQETSVPIVIEKKLETASTEVQIREGALEYIDILEQQTTFIALSIEALQTRDSELKEVEDQILKIDRQIVETKLSLEHRVESKTPVARTVAAIPSNIPSFKSLNISSAAKKILEGVLKRAAIKKKAGFVDQHGLITNLELTKKNLERQLARMISTYRNTASSFTTGITGSQANIAKFKHTHVELDPQTMFGPSAAVMPYVSHNQAPRINNAGGMKRQLLGSALTSANVRHDLEAKYLDAPTDSIVKAHFSELMGQKMRGQGKLTRIAFMATYGTTQEDMIQMKKSYVERGGHRSTRVIRYDTTIGNNQTEREELSRPNDRQLKANPKIFEHLDEQGVVKVGSMVITDDILVAKKRTIIATGEVLDDYLTVDKNDNGVVDEVIIIPSGAETLISIRIRLSLQPTQGDKFASPHAQKATLGETIADEYMPFDSNGISPDIIINPHAIPGRMTGGSLMAVIAGRVGQIKGEKINASAFRKFNYDEFVNYLQELGFRSSGKTLMYSGITGEPMQASIFVGPELYSALKHQVVSKYQVRGGGGRVDLRTNQAIKGKKRGGSIRFGGMESDATLSHGAAAINRERLHTLADSIRVVTCINCGRTSTVRTVTPGMKCTKCGREEFGVTDMPNSYQLLGSYLATVGIDLSSKVAKVEDLIRAQVKKPLSEEMANPDDLEDIVEESDKATEEDIVDDYDAYIEE